MQNRYEQTNPHQKYTIEKLFHIILQIVDTTGLNGGTFVVFFLNTQTSQRGTVSTVGHVCDCSNCPSKTMLLGRLHGKWQGRVGNIRFCSPIMRMGHGASINGIPRTWPLTLQKAANHLLRHS